MKYIIFDVNGLECPVIFSELLTHSDVRRGFPDYYKIVSAGFCRAGIEADTHGNACAVINGWGKSVSLKLESRKEDSALLTKENEREL
jgi:hypothetical protein